MWAATSSRGTLPTMSKHAGLVVDEEDQASLCGLASMTTSPVPSS